MRSAMPTRYLPDLRQPVVLNIARMFGGELSKERAGLIATRGSRGFVLRCGFEIPPASQAPTERKSRIRGTPGRHT